MTNTPWDALSRTWLHTCEPDHAGWILHPLETASSVAFVVVALAIWHDTRTTRHEHNARSLAPIVGCIGVASALFHASLRTLFHIVDVAAIGPLTAYFVTAVFIHRGRVSPGSHWRVAIPLALVGVAAPVVHLGLGFVTIAAQGLVVLWLWPRGGPRQVAGRRPDTKTAIGDIPRAAGYLLPGVFLLALDHGGIGCLRGAFAHVVQPHAVWHVLSAMGLWHLYRAECRLESDWGSTEGRSAPPSTVA
ncbi:MAG: hypothetical protein VYE68_06640 [Acidobacteriota bacterium]|nr:hypothetical protein [Acidobacteriota bacterium]